MPGSMKKLFGAWNDAKRRTKTENVGVTIPDDPPYSEDTLVTRPPLAPLSTTRARNTSSPSSSSLRSPSTPSSPIYSAHSYDQLRDPEESDELWSYYPKRSHSYRSDTSDSSQEEGDNDEVDPEWVGLLREWSNSPPSRFRMKRMGKGSRGRARPRDRSNAHVKDIAQDLEPEKKTWV